MEDFYRVSGVVEFYIVRKNNPIIESRRARRVHTFAREIAASSAQNAYEQAVEYVTKKYLKSSRTSDIFEKQDFKICNVRIYKLIEVRDS